MKYMILLYGSQQDYDAMAGKAERQAGLVAARTSRRWARSWSRSTRSWSSPGNSSTRGAWPRRCTPGGSSCRTGCPVVTDGPYAETQEVLAGYWIVECESFDRATEIAARLAELPARPERCRRRQYVDVRPIADGRRRAGRLIGRTETQRRGPAAPAGAAGPRRGRPPLRALRHRRGRRPGGAARRGRAQWPTDGVPDNPRGWLITVAARRLTDLLRSEQARRRREDTVAALGAARRVAGARPPTGRPAESDDTLILLFLCCHPALSPASQIALTLRAVGGLTTAEIARAFLVPEATMTRRISRAKQRIKDSGVPFGCRRAARAAERLGAVLHVLYLIFNEGYASTSGPSLHARRAVGRGDPAGPAGAPAAARRRRGDRPARADAAHRRPPAGPDRRRTAR